MLRISPKTLFSIVGMIIPASVAGQVPLPSAISIFDGTTLSQSVTVSVAEINEISVSGSVSITISNATAGSDPDGESHSSTTYNITVNGSDKKLTGALDATFDTGISLDVLLGAPTGASASQKTLGTSAQDLVTSITKVTGSGLSIAYTASATAQAAPNGAGQSRTVTFTLTDS